MLVCWEWLSEYVQLNVDHDDLALQFAMSGLNHEGTEKVGEDIVIDLEVTSNRGDCLGHIGVAREAAVLLGETLKTPEADVAVGKEPASSAIVVENEFHEGCPEYTARVIRGVKVGPSPAWLVRRLAAIGINSVNNVVDVTNYVMMECGQPLHAFDLAQIRGGKIIVRQAEEGEQFEAIDHRTYELDPKMVVIADAERAVALGGVMGGVDSEVSQSTTDLLIEAARFQPLSIRRTARKLKLHSPSSYRFERSPDPEGLDWASRRCCELILQLAGGELCDGWVSAGSAAEAKASVTFRLGQIPRVLGIDVDGERTSTILSELGCDVEESSSGELSVVPPSWRPDLTREIDLVEEVARIHGYDQIPEDVAVPIGVAAPRNKDIALGRARHVLSAYGIDEAMTPSVVGKQQEDCPSLWSNESPLSVDTPLLVGAKLLRRSLVPSLLSARYTNQTQAIRNAELYEIATIYLPGTKAEDLPGEQSTMGIVTSGDLQRIKGIVHDVIQEIVGMRADIRFEVVDHPLFAEGSGQNVHCQGKLVGSIGLLNPTIQAGFSLDQPVAVAELSVDTLSEALEPVRTAIGVSQYPSIQRDLNFVVDEQMSWAKISEVCKTNGGDLLQEVDYQETYRDAKRDGKGKKRILLALHFQSMERTLTNEEVDQKVAAIVSACDSQLDAKLLG